MRSSSLEWTLTKRPKPKGRGFKLVDGLPASH